MTSTIRQILRSYRIHQVENLMMGTLGRNDWSRWAIGTLMINIMG